MSIFRLISTTPGRFALLTPLQAKYTAHDKGRGEQGCGGFGGVGGMSLDDGFRAEAFVSLHKTEGSFAAITDS